MKGDEQVLIGQQRGEAYWFLSSLFADALDAETLARMAPAGVLADGDGGFAAEILNTLCEPVGEGVLAERLAVEHTRLFRGINEEYGPPPPYESLWREGLLMGDSTVQVTTHYLDAGYQPDGRFAPCDHLVEELLFMASLCNAEVEALSSSLPVNARQFRERQLRFLHEHLAAWSLTYFRRLAESAREPLYRALARVTASVVEQDLELLRGDS